MLDEERARARQTRIITREGRRMAEQRRHQRVRFVDGVRLRVGYDGVSGEACLENLSLGGLMLCCERELPLRAISGVEMSFSERLRVDLVMQIVNRVGNRYGARFSPGPLSEAQLRLAMSQGLASGKASSLSVKVESGRRVMRVLGRLGGNLRPDFLTALHAGVAEVDLSGVTAIDAVGRELCALVAADPRAVIVRPADCVRDALERVGSIHR